MEELFIRKLMNIKTITFNFHLINSNLFLCTWPDQFNYRMKNYSAMNLKTMNFRTLHVQG